MVDDARGGVPRHRPDLGLARARSRSARRRTARSSPAQGTFYLQAGAFPGSPIRGAAGCAFAPYDIPNVHSVGYRRGLQPLEGRGLSRAGRADRRLRGRMRDRRARRDAEDGPARAAPEERGASRAPRPRMGRSSRASATSRRSRRRTRIRTTRRRSASATQGRGVAQRLLVQRRRRIRARRSTSPRTAPSSVIDGPSGHRRLARVDRQHHGRAARHRLSRRVSRADRRHRRRSASAT